MDMKEKIEAYTASDLSGFDKRDSRSWNPEWTKR